jgi:hypothetical protein
MSNNAFMDRDIVPRIEYQLRRKLYGSLGKESQSCKKTHFCRLSGSRSFCNATNTSYADPPKMH